MVEKKKYVSIRDYQETDNLPGALSTDAEFSVIDIDSDDVKFVPMREQVSKDYREDKENKLFVNLNGVVANAFDLKFFSDAERPEVIKGILDDYQLKYPEYDFEMRKEKFPVKMTLGFEYRKGCRLSDYPTMSTHVLYIKNYGKFIKKRKMLIKK